MTDHLSKPPPTVYLPSGTAHTLETAPQPHTYFLNRRKLCFLCVWVHREQRGKTRRRQGILLFAVDAVFLELKSSQIYLAPDNSPQLPGVFQQKRSRLNLTTWHKRKNTVFKAHSLQMRSGDGSCKAGFPQLHFKGAQKDPVNPVNQSLSPSHSDTTPRCHGGRGRRH